MSAAVKASPKPWSKCRNLQLEAEKKLRTLAPVMTAKHDALLRSQLAQEAPTSQAALQQAAEDQDRYGVVGQGSSRVVSAMVGEQEDAPVGAAAPAAPASAMQAMRSLSAQVPLVINNGQAVLVNPAYRVPAGVQPLTGGARVPLPYMTKGARTSSLTLPGAVSRFVGVRNISGGSGGGGLIVLDMKKKSSPMNLSGFKSSYNINIPGPDGSPMNLPKVFANDAERDSTALQGAGRRPQIFTIVDDIKFDPNAAQGLFYDDMDNECMNTFYGLDLANYQPIAVPENYCLPILRFFDDIVHHQDVDPDGYIIQWMASSLQNLGSRTNVAPVMQGGHGTGKSTISRMMMVLLAPHSMIVSNVEQVLGKFNGHLEELLFLGLEEALWADNGKEVDAAKNLINSPQLTYEKKYGMPVTRDSFLDIMLTTNHDKAAPITPGERRYAVFNFGESSRYTPTQWTALNAGGIRRGSPMMGAFFQYLLRMDVSRFNPVSAVPKNSAMMNQMSKTLAGRIEFMVQAMLQEGGDQSNPGSFPGLNIAGIPTHYGDWTTSGLTIEDKEDTRRWVETWWKNLPQRYRTGNLSTIPNVNKIARALVKYMDAASVWAPGGNARAWAIPPLDDAKAAFSRHTGIAKEQI